MIFDMNSKYSLIPLFSMLCMAVTACSGDGGGGGNNPAPPPVTPPASNNCTTPISSGAAFVQTTLSAGLCYEAQSTEPIGEMQVMGGGLAMSDVDHDGFLDLYVVHGIGEKGRLYLSDGAKFNAAVANNGIEPRRLDNAGYFVDLDSDGWDDFVSIQYTTNFIEVFMNDQTGQFTEATASTGIYLRNPTYSMAAADYDLDGDIDLFFAHWGEIWSPGEAFVGYLWQNDGSGFFTDVTNIVEIVATVRLKPFEDIQFENSFTPTFADINSDGYPDILLTGDYESSQVLINNAGASFTDATTDAISDENGMGSAVADYDNDGDLDWFVTSIYFSGRDKEYVGGESGNRLYQNDGTGIFTDVTDTAGVRDGDWGWGACFADFDNDGNMDIFHTNGMRSTTSRDDNATDPLFVFFHDPSRLFLSRGDGTFAEVADAFGIRHDDQGRGVICTDLDNDGGVDVVIASNGKSPTIYTNSFANGNHYLQIDLEGPAGNREGIGARVTVETASGSRMQEMVLGSNYLSQQPSILHFGLGPDDMATTVSVEWPGLAGAETLLMDVPVDQRLTVAAP